MLDEGGVKSEGIRVLVRGGVPGDNGREARESGDGGDCRQGTCRREQFNGRKNGLTLRTDP